MIESVELSRRTWIAAVKLAVIISVVAAALVLVINPSGEMSQAAIVLPVIVFAFTASWIQSGRVRRPATMPVRRHHA